MTGPQRTRQKFVGRDINGDRVFVTFTRTHDDRIAMLRTIDHEPVTEPVFRYSLVGDVLRRGTSTVDRCGQINPVEIEIPAKGWTRSDVARLNEFWQRWHLNDMRAGCRHQEDAGSDAPPCPVTGYRWGSAWLYEPLTEEAVREYDYLTSLPEGSIPKIIQNG